MSPASADPPGLSRSLLSVKPFPWLRPRFIVFPKKKLLDPFKDLVAEGRRATSDQSMRANFDQVLDPLGLYEAAFNRYVITSRQPDKKNTGAASPFGSNGQGYGQRPRALLKEVDKALAFQKENMQSRVARATALIGGSAVLAIVVGLLVSLFLVRGLTRTLNRVISSLEDGSGQVAAASLEVSSASQSLARVPLSRPLPWRKPLHPLRNWRPR